MTPSETTPLCIYKRRWTSWLLLLLTAASVSTTGCAWKGGKTQSEQERATQKNIWHPAPVAIRVYPSSRFVDRDDAITLEARVELVDDMADPIKGAGDFRLDIYTNAGSPRDPRPGNLLYTWDVPVITLTDQKLHYDRITQSYLFRLKLYDRKPEERATLLRVVFSPPDSSRLEAQSLLKKWAR